MFNTFEYTGKMWNDLADRLDLANGWTVECTTHHMQSNDFYTLTHKATGKTLEIKMGNGAELMEDGRVNFYDACNCWEEPEEDDCGGYCEEWGLYSNWLVEVRILDGFAACGCCYADEDDEVDGMFHVSSREDLEALLRGLAVVSELPEVVAALLVDELETLESWKRVAYRGRVVDVADADEVAALFEAVTV